MIYFSWSKLLETETDLEQIRKQVNRLEIRYWVLFIVGLFVLIYGVMKLHQADTYDAVRAANGLFMMICGSALLAINGVVTRMSLNTYKILIALSKHQK